MKRRGLILVFAFIVITEGYGPLKEVKKLKDCSIDDKSFVSDFKVWKEMIYWGMTRYETDNIANVTLAVSTIDRFECRPYPNLEIQSYDDCTVLQSVSNLEIDPRGRLWILDRGSRNCPRKLLILDLATNGTVLRRYSFPNSKYQNPWLLVRKANSFVLDHKGGGYAYICWNEKPETRGIVVYSLSRNESWIIEERQLFNLEINKRVDRITQALLVLKDKFVYYYLSDSYSIYRIPVRCLLYNSCSTDQIDKYHLSYYITDTIMSADGVMFVNALGTRTNDNYLRPYFYTTDEQRGLKIYLQPIDNVRLMSIDGDGNFWTIDWNNWLYKSVIGTPNYQYYNNGSAPCLRILNAESCGESNFVSDFKIWNQNLFRAFVRIGGTNDLKVVLDVSPIRQTSRIKCRPYPNWEYQKLGNCRAFQSIVALEVDPKGRLWVLDRGSTNCPRKLVILDLVSNGTELHGYKFPPSKSFQDLNYTLYELRSFVLDHENGGYAYMCWNENPETRSITVYSLSRNRSWTIDVTPSISTTNRLRNYMVLALSSAESKERFLYYTVFHSRKIYSIPVGCLRNNNCTKVEIHEQKLSYHVRKMITSADGAIYMKLPYHVIREFKFNVGPFDITNVRTIDIDGNGNLWALTFEGELYKTVIGSANYQYYSNFSAPNLPPIP